MERAVENYLEAAAHFKNAGRLFQQANVQANLAYLLFQLDRWEEAHQQAAYALKYYKSVGDKPYISSVLDTKARIYLAQGKLSEARQSALASVKILEGGDRLALRAESLTTLGVVYARQLNWRKANEAFGRACEIAERAGDTAGASAAREAWWEECGKVETLSPA